MRAQAADDDRQECEVAETVLKERILDLRAVLDPVYAVVRTEHRIPEQGVAHGRIQRDRPERSGDGVGHRHDSEVADAIAVARRQQDHAADLFAVDRGIRITGGRSGIRIPGMRHDNHVAGLFRHRTRRQKRVDHSSEADRITGIPRTGYGRCENLRCGHGMSSFCENR